MKKLTIVAALASAAAACGNSNNNEHSHDNHVHTNNGNSNNAQTNSATNNTHGDTHNADTNGVTNGTHNAHTNNTANNTTGPKIVHLHFEALVNGGRFACDGAYTLGSMNTPATISDLKLYVSEVALIRADGTEDPVTLDDDGMWQNGSVALLDFEDGTGNCQNGTAPTRTFLTGTAEAGEHVGVAFTVGVPFEENHQDVAVAGAPLNLTSMFWNWQGGYKFLRLDGMADGAAGWRVHLGSTGCEMNGDMEVTSCANPNRVRVTLAEHALADLVALDIDALLADTDLTPDAEGSSAICMSAPDHAPCVQIFDKLGLPFMGAGGDNAQSVFE